MIRRIAALAALLLLTLTSAAMAHEHAGMPTPAASHGSVVPDRLPPAGEAVAVAARPDAACDDSHDLVETCSAICALACFAMLDDHAGALAAADHRTQVATAPAAVLTPTADAPPTPPPRA